MICDVGLAPWGWIEVDRMKHCQGQHRLGDALIFRFIVVHVELHIGFRRVRTTVLTIVPTEARSEVQTSELQALMSISYAVFCLKKNITNPNNNKRHNYQHLTHIT